jgi:hypothetical protein
MHEVIWSQAVKKARSRREVMMKTASQMTKVNKTHY